MAHDHGLGALLDQVHAAVIAADYAGLENLDKQIQDIIRAVGLSMDHDQLRRLQEKANRNALCLQAAGRGIRAAKRRLEEVRRAAAGLATYDGNGRRAAGGLQGKLSARF